MSFEITTTRVGDTMTITATWRRWHFWPNDLRGVPIEIDDALPPNTIEIRGPGGAVRFELPPEKAP